MQTIVLDTNIVSYFMRGHTIGERYWGHLADKRPAISFMTVAENSLQIITEHDPYGG